MFDTLNITLKSSRNSKQLPATLSNPTNLGLSLLGKEGQR